MTKSNIHKALGAAALLGMVLLTGCQDVSTDLKPPKYKTSIPENATRISSFKAECQCALQRDPPCARKSDPPLGVMCKDTKWGFNEGGKRGVA